MRPLAIAAGSLILAAAWSDASLALACPYQTDRPLVPFLVFIGLLLFWAGFFVGRWT